MTEDTQQWRRRRLDELTAVLGGKTELGRKLGYKDGQFIGQMLSQHRPVTEKTVAAIELIRDPRLPGGTARGWFDRAAPENAQRDLLEVEVAVPKGVPAASTNDVPTAAKHLIAQIAFVMDGMDEKGRQHALDAFAALAQDPHQKSRAEFLLAAAMVSVPTPPEPTAPKPKRKTTAAKTSQARKSSPPKLEVKAGGGQRSLLERIGIKPLQEVVLDDFASGDEKKLYKRFANYPKASDEKDRK